EPRPGPGAHPVPPGGDGAQRDNKEHSRPGPRKQSDARRLRLAVRDAVAVAELAALSTPDTRLEELLRTAALHRAAARRSVFQRSRCAATQHCERRHYPRTVRTGIRRRAPPA